MAKQGGVAPSDTEPEAVMSTEDRIRRAAVELFSARGFHGVGIRDLAQAADISVASLYHYMGTKEELVYRIMLESIGRLIDAAGRVTDGVPAPQERIVALTYMHVVTHALRSQETVVFDNEIRALTGQMHDDVVELRDTYERIWAVALAEGAESGVFNVEDVRLARLAVLQMCSSVARWFRPDGPRTASEVGKSCVRMVMALLEYDGEWGAGATANDFARYDRIVADVWNLQP